MQCGQGHGVVLFGPTRSYGNKLRFFFFEHFPVIGISAQRVRASNGFDPASLIRVGNRHYLNIFTAIEDQVMLVTIIAMAGVADDSRAKFRGSTVGRAHVTTRQSGEGERRTQEFSACYT
jgi:hypothetical protein